MKIAFTICSNNYLGAAKIMVESFKQFHPDFEIFIGLVDKLDTHIDYTAFNCNILLAEDVPMPDIRNLSEKFNIVELNTTVKPFYFKHFFFTLKAAQVIYLDPDTQIFSYLTEVVNGLSQAMITLTPHMLSPIDDEGGTKDRNILPTGIFNLGFVALAKHSQLAFFLDWWADRCVKYGFRRDTEGLFYDQIWINYVPAFFESYHIIRDPGYNVANWNLHERLLSVDSTGVWWVNGKYKLAFFHFSHYNINNPQRICSYNNRFTFENRPDLVPLFAEYQNQLVRNNGITLRALVPYYKKHYEEVKAQLLKSQSTLRKRAFGKIIKVIKRIVPE